MPFSGVEGYSWHRGGPRVFERRGEEGKLEFSRVGFTVAEYWGGGVGGGESGVVNGGGGDDRGSKGDVTCIDSDMFRRAKPTSSSDPLCASCSPLFLSRREEEDGVETL